MKIICKFKDYYDFVAGIYGTDKTIVYERIHSAIENFSGGKWSKVPLNDKWFSLDRVDYRLLAVCGKVYFIAKYNDDFYFGQQANCLLDKIYDKWGKSDFKRRIGLHNTETDLNNIQNCPILLCKTDCYCKLYAVGKNVRLSDYSFGSIVEPLTVFTQISEFLTRQSEIVDDRTDFQKNQAFGFDPKISFRKM